MKSAWNPVGSKGYKRAKQVEKLKRLRVKFFGTSERTMYTLVGVFLVVIVALVLLIVAASSPGATTAASQGSTVTLANPQTQDDGSDGLSPADTNGGDDASSGNEAGWLNVVVAADGSGVALSANEDAPGETYIFAIDGSRMENLERSKGEVLNRLTIGCGACLPPGKHNAQAFAYAGDGESAGESQIVEFTVVEP